MRARIEPRARDLYRDVESFWRASTAPDVLADVNGAPGRWQEAWDHFLEGAIVMTHVTTFAGEAFVALLTACQTAGRPELLARLNGGYGDTHDDEMSAAMWALAHGDVTMEKFLHEYGYQGNRAADLYATVWREDPGLLRPLLDAMASMPEPDGPEATGRARVQDRIDAERELLDALRGEARDAAVQAIADARRFTVLREHVKVVSQRSLDVARAPRAHDGTVARGPRPARRPRGRVPSPGRRVRHHRGTRSPRAGRVPQGPGGGVRDLRPAGDVRGDAHADPRTRAPATRPPA